MAIRWLDEPAAPAATLEPPRIRWLDEIEPPAMGMADSLAARSGADIPLTPETRSPLRADTLAEVYGVNPSARQQEYFDNPLAEVADSMPAAPQDSPLLTRMMAEQEARSAQGIDTYQNNLALADKMDRPEGTMQLPEPAMPSWVSIKNWEKQANALPDGAEKLKQQQIVEEMKGQRAFHDFEESKRKSLGLSREDYAVYKLQSGHGNLFMEAPVGIRHALSGVLNLGKTGLNLLSRATGIGDADKTNRLFSQQQRIQSALDRTSPIAGVIGETPTEIGGQAIESIAQMGVAGGLAGPQNAFKTIVGTAFAQSADELYTQGKDAHLAPPAAAAYAAIGASAEAALTILFGKLGKKVGVLTAEELMANQGAARKLMSKHGIFNLLGSMIAEYDEEAVIAAVQNFNDYFSGVDEEALPEFFSRANKAGMTGAAAAGMASGIDKLQSKWSDVVNEAKTSKPSSTRPTFDASAAEAWAESNPEAAAQLATLAGQPITRKEIEKLGIPSSGSSAATRKDFVQRVANWVGYDQAYRRTHGTPRNVAGTPQATTASTPRAGLATQAAPPGPLTPEGLPGQATSLPDIDPHISRLRAAFPGSLVSRTKDGYHGVELPNGKVLIINTNAAAENLLLSQADKEKVARDWGVKPHKIVNVPGIYRTVEGPDKEKFGLIQLVSRFDDGTLNHEAAHALFNFVYTPEEYKKIIARYGTEEKAAEAFRRRSGHTQKGITDQAIVDKLSKFVDGVRNYFGGDVFESPPQVAPSAAQASTSVPKKWATLEEFRQSQSRISQPATIDPRRAAATEPFSAEPTPSIISEPVNIPEAAEFQPPTIEEVIPNEVHIEAEAQAEAPRREEVLEEPPAQTGIVPGQKYIGTSTNPGRMRNKVYERGKSYPYPKSEQPMVATEQVRTRKAPFEGEVTERMVVTGTGRAMWLDERDLIPTESEPQRMVVAAVGVDGKVYYGKSGQTHADLMQNPAVAAAVDKEEAIGFAFPGGPFLTSAQALSQFSGVVSKSELKAGMLDSESLNQAPQPEAPPVQTPSPPNVSESYLRMSDQEKAEYIRSGYATEDEQLIFRNRASLSRAEKKRYDELRELIAAPPKKGLTKAAREHTAIRRRIEKVRNNNVLPSEDADFLDALPFETTRDIFSEADSYAQNHNDYLGEVLSEYNTAFAGPETKSSYTTKKGKKVVRRTSRAGEMNAKARLIAQRGGDYKELPGFDRILSQVEADEFPVLKVEASNVGRGDVAQGLWEMLLGGAKQYNPVTGDAYLGDTLEEYRVRTERQREASQDGGDPQAPQRGEDDPAGGNGIDPAGTRTEAPAERPGDSLEDSQGSISFDPAELERQQPSIPDPRTASLAEAQEFARNLGIIVDRKGSIPYWIERGKEAIAEKEKPFTLSREESPDKAPVVEPYRVPQSQRLKPTTRGERQPALAGMPEDFDENVLPGQQGLFDAAQEPPKKGFNRRKTADAPEDALYSFAGTRQAEAPKSAKVTSGDVTIKPVPIVELVRIIRQLLHGQVPQVLEKMGAYGQFMPGSNKIKIRADLAEDPKALAGTLAHEFGHLNDFLPDSTLTRGNILGRIASLKSYLKGWIAGKPGGPGPLTEKDRARLRREAEKLLGENAERIITREIMESMPITAQDILNIWNLIDQSQLNPELLAYIKGVSTAEKLSIVKEAMKGVVPAELQKFAHRVGTGKFETFKEVVPVAGEDIAKKYQELLLNEIKKRDLLSRQIIMEELTKVSTWWRGPFNKSDRYRSSSLELYADAVSVLINSPGDLQEKAPMFFKGFFNYLDAKPEFRKAYLGMQDLLNGTPESIADARREDIREMFGKGEDIWQARHKEREDGKQNVGEYLRQMLFDKASPIVSREGKLKKPSVPWDEAMSAKHALEELGMAQNALHLWVNDVHDQVSTALTDAGMDREVAGEYMMMRRIGDGDRGGAAEAAQELIKQMTGIDSWAEAKQEFSETMKGDPEAEMLMEQAMSGKINPLGYTPELAREYLADMKRRLGDDKYTVLEDSIEKLRDLGWEVIREAVKVGSYNRALVDKVVAPNKDYYAPFAVLKYLDAKMKAGIFKQIGTFEEIANPYDAYLLKMLSLIRLNELQKAKNEVIPLLDQLGESSSPQVVDQFHRLKPASPGKEHLWHLVDGKATVREVDPYIAKVFASHDIGTLGRLGRWLNSSYRVFHPLWIGYNIGWQASNLIRDPLRTYINQSALRTDQSLARQVLGAALDLGNVGYEYVKAIPPSWRRAFDWKDAEIRKLHEDRAITTPFVRQRPGDDTEQYDRILMESGVWEKPQSRLAIIRTLENIADGVERFGVFTETLSKVAMSRMAKKSGLTSREQAYVIRNYAGTPNTRRRGLSVELHNSIWMYANVVIQGYRADAEVAVNPNTLAGRWVRAALTQYLPKAAMIAAASALMGDWLKEFFDDVPEYDKTKYVIIPLGRSEGKPVYLRLPHNDTDRVLSGMAWKLAHRQDPTEAADLALGDLPGINPIIQSAVKWGQYLSGQNPRDEFRGRDIIPRDAQLVGGMERLKPMLLWQTDQLGVAGAPIRVLAEWERNAATGEETTTTEKIVNSTPGLSRLLKVSDRGSTESQWEDVSEEDAKAAAIRLAMPQNVRDLQRERYRLNRLGDDRIEKKDQARKSLLNAWFGGVYREALDEIRAAVESGDEAKAVKLRKELEAETGRILKNQSQKFINSRRAKLRKTASREFPKAGLGLQKRIAKWREDTSRARRELELLNAL